MTAARQQPDALLLDLDGVLRVFDPSVVETVERDFGLPAGALTVSAFAWGRIQPALVGQVSHEDWLDAIATDLAEVAGGIKPARAAVAQWQVDRGQVVPELLAFVREIRASGVPVALATNATTILDQDLARLGLSGEFDVVVNSSLVGAHKPSPEFFAAATTAVRIPPGRCLFVDDDDRHIRGARVAGLSAYRWNGPADLPYVRAALTGRVPG
ncbi:MAG TPA: HAD-IA family hydrolase [Micromonosporaceae bacterium]